MGGAQAIAALAYGTERPRRGRDRRARATLRQEAKRQVFGVVGIDGMAGPSELVVVAARRRGPGAGRARPARPGRARRGQPAVASISPDRVSCSTRSSRRSSALAPSGRASPTRRSALVRAAGRRAALCARRRDRARAPRAGGRRGRGPGRPRRAAGCVFVGRDARHGVRRLRRGLEPRAAHRAAPRASQRAVARRRSGAAWLAYRCPARRRPASRPPAPRWRAPRAFPSTPSRWSAARDPHAQTSTATHGETDVALSLASTGPARASARPGVGFFDHLLDAVARHGGLDLDVRCERRPRDRRRTTRWRTPASRSGRRSTRRSATARASPASATPWSRWTRRARAARSTSPGGRSLRFEARLPRRARWRTSNRPRRGVLPRGGQHRQAHAARARGGGHQRAPHGRGVVQGVRPRAARGGGDRSATSRACPPRRALL